MTIEEMAALAALLEGVSEGGGYELDAGVVTRTEEPTAPSPVGEEPT